LSVIPNIFENGQGEASGAVWKVVRFATYVTQSNEEQIEHVRNRILIGIVVRIAQTGNDL
jgi:hypothetical protein